MEIGGFFSKICKSFQDENIMFVIPIYLSFLIIIVQTLLSLFLTFIVFLEIDSQPANCIITF